MSWLAACQMVLLFFFTVIFRQPTRSSRRQHQWTALFQCGGTSSKQRAIRTPSWSLIATTSPSKPGNFSSKTTSRLVQQSISASSERQSPWWTKESFNLETLRQSTMSLTGSMCWGTSTLTLRYDFQHSCFFLSHILLFQVGKKFIWSNCIHSKGYKPHGQHELYSIPGYDLYNAGFGICDKLNRFFFILSVAT